MLWLVILFWGTLHAVRLVYMSVRPQQSIVDARRKSAFSGRALALDTHGYTVSLGIASLHIDTTWLNNVPACLLAFLSSNPPAASRPLGARSTLPAKGTWHASGPGRIPWWDLGAVTTLSGPTLHTLARRSLATVASPTATTTSSAADTLLLRPVIPGVTQPVSALPTMLAALVLASIVHECGHALAATTEGVPVISMGLYVIVALPTFYVHLATEKQSLRILGAGVWHNLVLALLAWLLSPTGGHMGSVFSLPFYETVKGGLAVVSVDHNSPLHPYLPPLSVITHLDDVELDSAAKPPDVWSWYLSSPPNTTNSATYESMGWCLPDKLFTSTHPDCCISETPLVSSTSHELCFVINDAREVHRQNKACLDPMPLFYPSTSVPNRCLNDSGCGDGDRCATLNRAEMVLRIGVAPNAREKAGRTVVWQGRKQTILHQVVVTDTLPRTRWIPVTFLRTIADFYRQLISFSLVLAFFNSLPLPLLDGSHLLHTFLTQIANPSANSREEGLGIVVDPEPGPLASFMEKCGNVKVLKSLAKRRDKVVQRIKVWTLFVTTILILTTLLVEWFG
ncbi:hypothetical protein OIV83_002042 [Microbotryomycetes sp. JL201]|nr:hypothetical protein OIV83_002042 [Microbotryomycetes sp. JL201]